MIFGLLVGLFTFFYATVVWEQQNLAENLQKQGAFIPGIRPGAAHQGVSDARDAPPDVWGRRLPGDCGGGAALITTTRTSCLPGGLAADYGRRGAGYDQTA